MKKTNQLIAGFAILASLFSTNLQAQRGVRISAITGVSSISIKNAADASAKESVLKQLPTGGVHYGVEAAYHFRYFGIGMQLMRSQAGQKYMVDALYAAQTRFTYIKPTFLLHFNTNPANDLRLSGFAGVGYGLMNSFRETNYAPNAFGGLTKYTWQDKTYTQQDTGTIVANVNQQIYGTTDMNIVGGLGVDIRMSKRWLLGIHGRVDLGNTVLENNSKLIAKFDDNKLPTNNAYQPWFGVPSKFHYDEDLIKIRTGSKNMSMGVFVSLRYMLFSASNYEYEMNGY